MKLQGTIFGIYIYHGVRVWRIKCDNGSEVYLDDDFKPVRIVNEDELQTVKIRKGDKLLCPWTGH